MFRHTGRMTVRTGSVDSGNSEKISTLSFKNIAAAAAIACVMVSTAAVAVPIVHTTDFINDASRTHFNGFENIPVSTASAKERFTGGNGPYVEDNIQVEQVNGDGAKSIWTNCTGFCIQSGARGWYPDGGDHGFTQITLADGSGFDSVGFFVGTGTAEATPMAGIFDLLLGGVSVLTQSFTSSVFGDFVYLGFSGGGFDTIRLVDVAPRPDNIFVCANTTVTDGCQNTLTLDSIETFSANNNTGVPEPGTFSLLLAGLTFLGVGRRFSAKGSQKHG